MTQLRIRILRSPGIENTDETVKLPLPAGAAQTFLRFFGSLNIMVYSDMVYSDVSIPGTCKMRIGTDSKRL